MGDIRKKMEKAVRAEDIREKSGQHTESLRATAADSRSGKSKGNRGLERERERERVEAERSGDIEEQTETQLTPEEAKKKAREKSNRNLLKPSELTADRRREIARQGGLASAAARKRKKDIREVFDALLSSPATPEMQEKAEKLGFDAETVGTIYDVLGVAMINKALSGDGYCFQLVRDSAGDKPTDKSEVTASVMTGKDLEIMRNLEARIKAEKSATDGQKPE